MPEHVVEMAGGVSVRDCFNAGATAIELTLPYSAEPHEDLATVFEALAHVIRARAPEDVQVRGAVYSDGEWRLDVVLYAAVSDGSTP